MKDQETPQPTMADQRIANQARTWRRAEKRHIGERTGTTKDALYHEIQKLREAVDTNGGS